MKHMNYILILLMALSLCANAEVFKCKNATGKIIYQSEACSSGAVSQGVIKVKKMTPEEDEAAKAKLKAWREQQAVDDAAKQEAEKQRQAELQRQESLELQRRSVIAQEQQVIAEQQRQNQPIIVMPPFGRGRYWNNNFQPAFDQGHPNTMPHHSHHDQWEHPMPPPQSSLPSSGGLSPGSPAPHPDKPGYGLLGHHQ
jgi:hypothetical protein